ncbi:SWIM zinc finger family protein [Nocardiopsis suaedae]|uniref:SWIM zinc finger family protein n=1 Tax=Nocardiopsis suaedae TaxID=3018444 RepID=A0ABT4TKT8_9ACTN|nr:SWIM zinc finger family protein [Nocardiopsis suaedae]MDA2805304.1 SWIM zinc finger family protein [Nocardiopsis suaedae]
MSAAGAEPSWWSRRFMGALESGTGPGRLARGQAYAERGAVEGLKVAPGEVRAQVRGGTARPYRVSVIRVALEDGDWERVLGALAGQPLFRARLLGGELPVEVDRVFDVLGLSLFPRGLDELVLTCSCPNWGDPCEHAAATLLALSDAVAKDPFLLTTWLGLPRAEFLAGLRRHAGQARRGRAEGGQAQDGDPFADERRPGAEPPPLPEDPERFWTHTPVLEPPRPLRPQPALYAADPDEEGGPGDGVGDAALLDALEPLYARMTGDSSDD